MGADGATAMREMKDAASYNYVQDEASCIVFECPVRPSPMVLRMKYCP
jgi:two-component system chemotaxis response regulator CheB